MTLREGAGGGCTCMTTTTMTTTTIAQTVRIDQHTRANRAVRHTNERTHTRNTRGTHIHGSVRRRRDATQSWPAIDWRLAASMCAARRRTVTRRRRQQSTKASASHALTRDFPNTIYGTATLAANCTAYGRASERTNEPSRESQRKRASERVESESFATVTSRL